MESNKGVGSRQDTPTHIPPHPAPTQAAAKPQPLCLPPSPQSARKPAPATPPPTPDPHTQTHTEPKNDTLSDTHACPCKRIETHPHGSPAHRIGREPAKQVLVVWEPACKRHGAPVNELSIRNGTDGLLEGRREGRMHHAGCAACVSTTCTHLGTGCWAGRGCTARWTAAPRCPRTAAPCPRNTTAAPHPTPATRAHATAPHPSLPCGARWVGVRTAPRDAAQAHARNGE
jgi:hypothetical protein